ncbi:MAG: HNH endonuclease signature motif containing protein, partial [Microbacterium sp.]
MTFIGDIREAVDRLAVFSELAVPTSDLPVSVTSLSDAAVGDLLGDVSSAIHELTVLQTVLTGVVAQRSRRDLGGEGMAAKGGFRSPVEMIRIVTGTTKAEAARAVKVGTSLVDSVPTAADGADGSEGGAGTDAAASATPWFAPLQTALLAGRLTQAQYDAIFSGLGEPPDGGGDATVDASADAATIAAGFAEAWRLAADELARDAARWTVEQLRDNARTLRDLLDEDGAQERLRARFAARTFRMWRDDTGQRRGTITFDDEMGEWLANVFDAALRPRRGGPRFVTEGERVAADELAADPRSNEQLAYDLLADLLRAGALAEAKDVFGAREPGVRLVAIQDAVTGESAHRDALGRLVATGWTEDGATTVDGATLERALCAGGAVAVIVDTCGRPLDLGREERLFTPAQKLALALRDGGCLWPGCDRPPSYCEAHHCVEWSRGGTTDCDQGILLCRYHHLTLHNQGWRIASDAGGEFVLHAPAASGARDPIALCSKSPLRWLWDPPPPRAGWRAAPAASVTPAVAAAPAVPGAP